jgi:BirA family biotin operon repressor/biotin-[acetyl-CoA-carboxylase] ligase
MTRTLTPEAVEPLLRGRFGHPYIYRPSCATTQEIVRGLAEGAVAAADEQTAGRGRRGRRWSSAPGAGLLFSLSLRPAARGERLAPLSLVLADAVAAACHERAEVRWPNDVVIDGRKLAGVLPELRDGQLVAGIGINVNQTADELPADIRVPPTSLRVETGAVVDRAALLARLLVEIERRYDVFERDGFTGLERDELRGRWVSLVGAGEGLCDGTAADGRLIVNGVLYASAEVERVDVADGAARA